MLFCSFFYFFIRLILPPPTPQTKAKKHQPPNNALKTIKKPSQLGSLKNSIKNENDYVIHENDNNNEYNDDDNNENDYNKINEESKALLIKKSFSDKNLMNRKISVE